MTDDQVDRLIAVFGRIADALDRAYPVRDPKISKEAVVTHALSEEELLRLEQQGEEGEDILPGGRNWDEPGPRELEFMGSAKRSE